MIAWQKAPSSSVAHRSAESVQLSSEAANRLCASVREQARVHRYPVCSTTPDEAQNRGARTDFVLNPGDEHPFGVGCDRITHAAAGFTIENCELAACGCRPTASPVRARLQHPRSTELPAHVAPKRLTTAGRVPQEEARSLGLAVLRRGPGGSLAPAAPSGAPPRGCDG